MEWFAFVVIGLMLAHHFEIQRRTEDPRNWEKTLQHYRWTVRGALLLCVLLLLASVFVFSADVFMNGQIGLINRTKEFFQGDKPVSVLVIAFFVGIARLVAERAMDTKDNLLSGFKEFLQSFFSSGTLKRHSSIGNLSNFSSGPQTDAWFYWLCFSLIISVLDASIRELPFDATDPATPATPVPTEAGTSATPAASTLLGWYFAGLGASLYVAIGYFVWVYMTLYLKLVQHHHFAGRAARLFLGQILGDQLPRQCTIIGPSYSGKTVFARQGGATAHDGEAPNPHHVEPTSTVDVRTAPATSDHGITLNVTTLDTPGENMGDHLLLASAFRSDVLIFVLDLGMFDPTAMANGANYKLEDWHHLIRQDQDAEAVRSAVKYMQGFHLATTRSTGAEFVSASELFKVRAFTLFLNRKEAQVLEHLRPVLDQKNEDLQRLARDIGERFGVPERECCCIAGDANNATEAFHLIARSTRIRLRDSFWPGNLSVVGREE
ncbi:MAG: hypothetical protein OXF11_02605 [Deltaproteobacteria bacterium]|nr:hypothetical protein [Deltaproteobacteria bacterium]